MLLYLHVSCRGVPAFVAVFVDRLQTTLHVAFEPDVEWGPLVMTAKVAPVWFLLSVFCV